MKHIEAIEFPGIMNVLENIDIYKEKFLKESVILFRNANLSYEDQSFLHNEMGKIFNYIPVLDTDSRAERYVENHSTRNLIGEHERYDELMLYFTRRSITGTIITNNVIDNFLDENVVPI